MPGNIINYLLLLSSMSLGVIGQFLLKKGVIQSHLSPTIESILSTLFSPHVLLGFGLYGVSSIIWLFILQRFPLSVAYPSLSLTYVIILFFSAIFLHEPLTLSKIGGVLLITTGVFFLYK